MLLQWVPAAIPPYQSMWCCPASQCCCTPLAQHLLAMPWAHPPQGLKRRAPAGLKAMSQQPQDVCTSCLSRLSVHHRSRSTCLRVPCCAVLCHAMPCCAVPCHAMLCCAVLCRAVLCCAVPCCAVPAVLCRAVPSCAVPCCVLPCRAVPCRAVPCCAVLCCAVLCCVLAVSAMLCIAEVWLLCCAVQALL